MQRGAITNINLRGDRVALEEVFYVVSVRIRELLSPGHSRSFVLSSATVSEVSEATTRVCLPKLNLPTFSGRYEWFPFFGDRIHVGDSCERVPRLYTKIPIFEDISDR